MLQITKRHSILEVYKPPATSRMEYIYIYISEPPRCHTSLVRQRHQITVLYANDLANLTPTEHVPLQLA
jgi:hypothetical protein